ncbi:MAG: 3'-5' exonuclease, partial [Leptospiraceae bacterium]|nr:3'-5' exonuclease [Leptospiraceae bacterium]
MPSEFLDQLTWVAVDTETTGLNPWKNELLEIGAVRFQLDSEFEEFEVLIKPEGKIDPRSRAVHNITNEEIEERGKDLETAMKMFVEFIGKDSLVFHNAPFDISFLLRGIEKVNLPVPDNTYYDSLYLSRKYFAHRKKHSLSALREQLDLPEEVLHRALPDARLTAHVFSETIRSKAEQLTSNNKYQSFIRSHGRFSKFKIKLPKNMEDI